MMEKIKENKGINVKIERIRELSFQCNELTEVILNKLNEKNISFGFGIKLNPNQNTKEFGIALLVKYVFNDGDLVEDLCGYEIECVFKVIEFDEAIKIGDNKVNIEDGILSNLLSITIGSIRGMLAIKTAGNVLNKYPLPLIDPMNLIKQLKTKD